MLDTALHTHHLMCVLSYRAYRRFQPEKYVKRSCLCVFFLRCEHSILYSYMYFNPHVYRTEKKTCFLDENPNDTVRSLSLCAINLSSMPCVHCFVMGDAAIPHVVIHIV